MKITINNKVENKLTNNGNNGSSSTTRQKPKPEPLKIPDTISAFQQQNVAAAMVAVMQQAHIYPQLTLLKSPHFNYEAKKQYTPPPMLSPFRKGTGLFYKLASMFPIPPLYNRTASGTTAAPPLNHSLSCSSSYIYSPSSFLSQMANPCTDLLDNSQNKQPSAAEQIKETASGANSAQSSGFTPRPSLLRSRLSKIFLLIRKKILSYLFINYINVYFQSEPIK